MKIQPHSRAEAVSAQAGQVLRELQVVAAAYPAVQDAGLKTRLVPSNSKLSTSMLLCLVC